MVVAAFVLLPILLFAVRVAAERFKTGDSDLVLVIVVTFLCAAATERIGVHAVFGAFVAGVVLHQVPRLRKETVARLESFTFSVLAPIFFGIVGLHVNLWELGGGWMLTLVIIVACLGKLIGCALGAYWGGRILGGGLDRRGHERPRRHGDRGGHDRPRAGDPDAQMFSIIVVMAIVTSLLAPIGLRLTMPRVRMTEEEARRSWPPSRPAR